MLKKYNLQENYGRDEDMNKNFVRIRQIPPPRGKHQYYTLKENDH